MEEGISQHVPADSALHASCIAAEAATTAAGSSAMKRAEAAEKLLCTHVALIATGSAKLELATAENASLITELASTRTNSTRELTMTRSELLAAQAEVAALNDALVAEQQSAAEVGGQIIIAREAQQSMEIETATLMVRAAELEGGLEAALQSAEATEKVSEELDRVRLELSAAQNSSAQLAASQQRVTELEALNPIAAQNAEAAAKRAITLLAELTVSRADLAVADAMATGLTAEVVQLTADRARLTTSADALLREKEQAQEASIELGAAVADLQAELAAAQEATKAGAQLASLDLAAADVWIASLEQVGALGFHQYLDHFNLGLGFRSRVSGLYPTLHRVICSVESLTMPSSICCQHHPDSVQWEGSAPKHVCEQILYSRPQYGYEAFTSACNF